MSEQKQMNVEGLVDLAREAVIAEVWYILDQHDTDSDASGYEEKVKAAWKNLREELNKLLT